MYLIKYIVEDQIIMKKKNNNQKIFENIFYYMGKFRNTDKEIRIEII